MCQLRHVAVTEFNRYTELFEKFGMNVQRLTGVAPFRHLWFTEGIQLKEASVVEIGNNVDYIALGVKNIKKTVKIALENGCYPPSRGDNWFVLPNGINIELMEE